MTGPPRQGRDPMKKHSIKTVDALFVQAGIAAALSFSHLHDLAAAAGQGTWQAWAYPVSVDLLLFAAWRRIRAGRGGAQVWCWFIVALVASLTANLATAGLMAEMPPTLRLIIAGWPAVAFLGGTLLVHGKRPTEPVDTSPTPASAFLPLVDAADLPVNAFLEIVPDAQEEEAAENVSEPAKPARRLSKAEAADIIEKGWRHEIDPELVAIEATRHPVSVRRQYKALDEKYGKAA